VRIVTIGLAAALVVLAAGAGLARVSLGTNDVEARERTHSEVRDAFAAMTRDLRAVAIEARDRPDAHFTTASQRARTLPIAGLFASAAAAIDGSRGLDLALTFYDDAGRPLAWAGRPTDPRRLALDRLQRNESWFIVESERGLRLVYVGGINDGTARLGTVAAERPLQMLAGGLGTSAGRSPCGERTAFCFPTRLGAVAIELPGSAPPLRRRANAFDVSAPSGELLFTAWIRSRDLESTRARWWQATRSIALMVLAATILLLLGPLLDRRHRVRTARAYLVATLAAAACILVGRALMSAASPADWTDARLFSSLGYASALFPPLLTSPFDFLLTWVTVAALFGLAWFGIENWRVAEARRRLSVHPGTRLAGYALVQLAAGAVFAALLLAHEAILRDTISQTSLDLVHFSLQPWDTSRLAIQVGLIVLHATVMAAAVLTLRAALVKWRLPRHDWRLISLTIVCWVLPLAVVWIARSPIVLLAPIALTAAVVLAALGATALKARYRHGSQAFRLMLLALGLIVPAVASYPTLFHLANRSKAEFVETRLALQALRQRETMTRNLDGSKDEIDTALAQIPDLAEQLRGRDRLPHEQGSSAPRTGAAPVTTDLAFSLWKQTALGSALDPITSSVELYGPTGTLRSRFAFNLPEALVDPRADEPPCTQTTTWGEVYGEVAPFFADERPMLHAGRPICSPSGARIGSVVVHAILDYENLPFISSRTPYRELLRPSDSRRASEASGREDTFDNLRSRDVEFAFYGWSGRPLYPTGEPTWQLGDALLNRLVGAEDRRDPKHAPTTARGTAGPFWEHLRRGDALYNVYLQSDRSGIYALGFPVVTSLGHLVNIAELTTLAAGTYCLFLLVNGVIGWAFRRTSTAPALLREIRASFYRKLFLAFVAAVIFPVVALALLTRNYVADEMRSSIEQEAVRTAKTARTLVEDLVTVYRPDDSARLSADVGLDDNLMVLVSRLIDQDVNIFDGPQLVATSERDLFASDLLPTRIPADVYRALQLRNEESTVTHERVGTLEEYLVAATPLSVRRPGVMLTVPLTTRQQDIEDQITTLTRRLLLGALIFVFGGAFLGYWMAERISDPVNRLTRATRRISRGDLDARILARSSDELRRLVDDFNSMAGELQRQRRELERTHRLEAWAEMARQVAHDIKNPLTPIQLTAEHLRRVHADRGEPLTPVLQDCVHTILTQVRLLRQIASEFSSFASSPSARPALVSATELIREIVEPYKVGLQDRIRFEVEIPETLPSLYIDRGLIARALSNLVENALHAMPGRGTLTLSAEAQGQLVVVRVSDTGAGMDAEAIARAFEPYFSTKATGTGLGLTIAKRNVELNGGTIAVSSEKGRGTTVELRLPAAR
jgi:signal transduction histidine kinase